MKNIVSFCVLAVLFASCIDDVENVEELFPQQWQLVRMTGQSGITGKADGRLAWKEFYLLNPDGTFLKSRLQDGVKSSATGMYGFVDTEDESLLVLTYDSPSDIIGSCESNQTETLRVLSNSILIGTWAACDGPGLEYYRVK